MSGFLAFFRFFIHRINFLFVMFLYLWTLGLMSGGQLSGLDGKGIGQQHEFLHRLPWRKAFIDAIYFSLNKLSHTGIVTHILADRFATAFQPFGYIFIIWDNQGRTELSLVAKNNGLFNKSTAGQEVFNRLGRHIFAG